MTNLRHKCGSTVVRAIALALSVTTASLADGPPSSLRVGDEAPAVDIACWLKGDEVPAFKPGQVYVLEFWATWCGPCRTSIPHLSELQERHGDDVIIIGVSREPLQKVVDFVCREDRGGNLWFDEVRYTLATDPDGSVNKDYMKAAGRRGIPTAFIIGKDGRIEWIGHPRRMDDVLDAVIAGTWDRAKPQASVASPFSTEFETVEPRYAIFNGGPPEDAQLLMRWLIVMLHGMSTGND